MLKFLKLWVFFCLAVAANVSFANSAETEVFDHQEDYKVALESAKNFHEGHFKKQFADERPKSPELQGRSSFDSLKLKTHQSLSAFDRVLNSLADSYDSMVREIRTKWRALRSIKSAPPYSAGLLYQFASGGPNPEVLWYPDASGDSDGYIVGYEYSFGDGTVQYIPATDIEPSKTISHIYSQPGTYSASLKLIDNDGDYSIFNKSITIPVTNSLPVPKFTFQNNQVPNFLKVDFTSQATDDGSIGRYTWRFGDGSADLVGSAATTASRTYAAPGIYNVSLTVRDNHRGQMNAQTQVYVGVHQPTGGSSPISLVYANTLAGSAPLNVQFDGEKSFDIGGSIASYSWNFGDYASPLNLSRSSKPSYTYMQPGTYYGSLTVTDNGGLTAIRYFAVHVLSSVAPSLPAQIFAYPESNPRSFKFDSDYRAIHAAAPSYYHIWNFGDGTPVVKGIYPNHTYAADGIYTVTLKIYDVSGGVQQIQKDIIVNSNQNAPISSFGAFPNNVIVGETVNLNTYNPSFVNPTTLAVWDFGDGNRLTGLHKDLLDVTHTYSQKGFYVVSLMVTDDFGKSSVNTYHVNVQDTSRPVQAKIAMSDHLGTIPFPVRFDGRETISSAGSIVKYIWRVWGPSGALLNENGVWTQNFTTGGDRYVDLFVEDSAGNIGYAADYLSVVDPNQIPPSNQNPTANIQMDFFQTGVNTGANLNAYGSWDPDGDRIAEYTWIFDGSIVSTAPTATIVSYGKNINRMVSLRVKDKWGAVGEQKFFFRNPTLSFDYVPATPIVGFAATFLVDEENMDLPDGSATEYRWDFGDGTPIVYGSNPSHIFLSSGTYTVSVVVKDVHMRTYTSTKQVVVENVAPPDVVITARDSGNVMKASGPNAFRWNTFPVDVTFDLSKSNVQGKGIQSAQWDFGDGNTGFGLNPTYSYQKPGVYLVTVNATDSQGNADTANIQVIVGNWNCSDTDGVDGCLKLANSEGHTLPMSETEWLISHDADSNLTWAPDVGDESYIFLTPIEPDGAAEDINITSAIVVDGVNLKIQKSLLQAVSGVDLLKQYRISVSTKLSDDSDFSGTFPKVYFGVGTINISVLEEDVLLTIVGTNGYRRYIDLGSSMSRSLNNLPVGTYTVVAEKDGRSSRYGVDIDNSTPKTVSVDLSTLGIEKNRKVREALYETIRSDLSEKLKNQKDYSTDDTFKLNGANSVILTDHCGNTESYPFASETMPPPRGISYIFFGTGGRGQEPDNLRLDRSFGETLKFQCSIFGGYHRYQAYKWWSYDSVARCWDYSQGPIPASEYSGWNGLAPKKWTRNYAAVNCLASYSVGV